MFYIQAIRGQDFCVIAIALTCWNSELSARACRFRQDPGNKDSIRSVPVDKVKLGVIACSIGQIRLARILYLLNHVNCLKDSRTCETGAVESCNWQVVAKGRNVGMYR